MAERTVDFDGLTIVYDDQVLEPRPWTVAQGQWGAKLAADLRDGAVLELCAGAGQIGLLVARDTGRRLVQVDVDERACDLACRNAATAGIVAEVRCGDLEATVAEQERFPLILADPPYVPADRVAHLPDDPEHAIHGGDDGLDLVRRCLRVAAAHLATDGLVVLQLGGPGQTEAVTEEAPSYGLEVIDAQTHGGDRSLVLLRSAST